MYSADKPSVEPMLFLVNTLTIDSEQRALKWGGAGVEWPPLLPHRQSKKGAFSFNSCCVHSKGPQTATRIYYLNKTYMCGKTARMLLKATDEVLLHWLKDKKWTQWQVGQKWKWRQRESLQGSVRVSMATSLSTEEKMVEKKNLNKKIQTSKVLRRVQDLFKINY